MVEYKEHLSLTEALVDLKKENRASFHMPGHKYGGLGLKENFPNIWDLDVTEIPGSDNLHDPEDILLYAKERAQQCYGSKESFFLVNGSSCGIMAMIMGTVRRGDKILISRDAHRSVHQAVSLGGFHPIYVMPEVDSESAIAIGLGVTGLRAALDQHPDIKAVICTYPSYSGACTDLEALSAITKAHQIPLLVDEAHGAHLWLSDELPPSALTLGADVVVQSLHKTMPALTQTAILHLGTHLASRDRICHYLTVFQSSSPSYVLLSSIDEAIRIGSVSGSEAMKTLLSEVRAFKIRMEALGFSFWDQSTLSKAKGFDETKICIQGFKLGLNGYGLEERLRARGIQAEYAVVSHVLLMTSIASEPGDLHRLERALTEISREMEDAPLEVKASLEKYMGTSNLLYGETVVLPADVDAYAQEWIEVDSALGQVGADWVIPYPPGIPLVCPGERIDENQVDQLKQYMESGHKLFGIKENRLRILTL